MRSEKELLIATRRFASENPLRSWCSLGTTLLAYGLALTVCVYELPIYARVTASIVSGLLVVRLFIIYHDFQHRAILIDSKLANFILGLYGMLVLSPPSVWNHTHQHHHKHNSKEFSASIGSFPTMTCQQFGSASWSERFHYQVARHPLTIMFGYVTIFMWSMCLRALWVNPRQHKDAGIAMGLHVVIAIVLLSFGWELFLLCMLLPLLIACGLGSYLFYVQHNFPGCQLNHPEDWTHASAALRSSSYLKMNPIMNWFTGNVGYHHVHHLNARIPFYRLPEAMAGLPELQKPASTTLRPYDIWSCFRTNLWDAQRQQFVSFREARRRSCPA